MKTKELYAIYDKETKSMAPPFTAENTMQAFKMTQNFLENETFPLDFQLFHIGSMKTEWKSDEQPEAEDKPILTTLAVNLTHHWFEFVAKRNQQWGEKHFELKQDEKFDGPTSFLSKEDLEYFKKNHPERFEEYVKDVEKTKKTLAEIRGEK